MRNAGFSFFIRSQTLRCMEGVLQGCLGWSKNKEKRKGGENWFRLKTFYTIFFLWAVFRVLESPVCSLKSADRQLWTVQWMRQEYWFLSAFSNLGSKTLQSPDFQLGTVFLNSFCNVLITNWCFLNKRHQDFSFQQPLLSVMTVVEMVFLHCGQASGPFYVPFLLSAVYLAIHGICRVILRRKNLVHYWNFVIFLLLDVVSSLAVSCADLWATSESLLHFSPSWTKSGRKAGEASRVSQTACEQGCSCLCPCSRLHQISLQSLHFLSAEHLSLDLPARCFPFKPYWFPLPPWKLTRGGNEYCNYIIYFRIN